MMSIRLALWTFLLLCLCVSFSDADRHAHRRSDSPDTTISSPPSTLSRPSSTSHSVTQTTSTKEDGARSTSSVSTHMISNTTTSTSSTSLTTSITPTTSNTLVPTATAINSTAINSTAIVDPLPLTPQLTPGLGVGGGLLILSGIAYSLVGIRNKRLQIGLSAAYLGSVSITVLVLYVMIVPVSWAVQGAYVVAVTIAGLIVGGVSMIFPDITEGFAGLFGGFSLAMWLLVLVPGGLLKSTTSIVIFIVSFTVTAFSTTFSRYTRPYGLIGSTAFGGGTAVVIGIDCFSQTGLKEFWAYIWNLNLNLFPPGTTTYPLTRGMKVEIAATIVIFLIGIIVQSRLWKVMKERREQRAAKAREYGRSLTREEEILGRRVEFVTTRERMKWEAIYGDKAKIWGSEDSGVGAIDSPGTEKSNPSTSASHAGPIELPELPDSSLSLHNGLLAKGRESAFLVTVVEDDEPEQDEPNRSSELGNGAAAKAGSDSGAECTEEQKDNSLRPKSAKPSGQEIRDRIGAIVDGTTNSALNSTPPAVVPLPFKIPENESDEDRSSVATMDDNEIGNQISKDEPKGKIVSRNSFRKSQQELKRTAISRMSHTLVVSNEPGDRSSVAATVDDLTDDEDERSLPDVSPPRSPTTEHRNEQDGLASVPEEISTKEMASNFENSPKPNKAETGAESPSTSSSHSESIPDATEDRKAKSSMASASGSNRGTSVTSKSVRFSLTEDKLPVTVSKVVMSYRTNEWAKHLSYADPPEVDDLKLTKGIASEPSTEKPAQVNVDELQQTPETGSVPPRLRTILKPARQSTLAPQSGNRQTMTPTSPPLSQQNSNRLHRTSSTPLIGPALVESPREGSNPLSRQNSTSTLSSQHPSLPGPASGFPSRAYVSSPDVRLADDNISLAARRSMLLHSNSFPAQPIALPHRFSQSQTQLNRQSSALRASQWRATMQAELSNRDNPQAVIEERRSTLLREKMGEQEAKRREDEEAARAERERDERRRRSGVEMDMRHREAMRRLQRKASRTLEESNS